jgi:Domain of unknown function (DUF3786)
MEEGRNSGEDKAWDLLAALNPDEVCRSASVSYDTASESYRIRSFDMEFSLSVKEKVISSADPDSGVLLQRLGYFFRLSVLWYLVNSKDIACTGRLVKLQNIKGGDIFTKGSHVLPLEPVASKYGNNKAGFFKKGKSFGGVQADFGDAALRFYPMPRIPVILSLWLEDEEFPASADLFFDSTCDMQLPTDIIWSIAMMSILIML